MKFIPYGRQSIDNKDIEEVVKVLRSDWITQGPKIKEFEEALCKYTGAKYAVAVSSGTAALHLACLAAGIEKGDEVITSPITFVASANCILYCGGKPIFTDIQKVTANIDPDEIRKKINKRTKAIIPVHFAGNPCDLEEISDIARKNKLFVIEDAAHALGAQYNGSKIGSCKYSDITIFSFHPVKSITTGEGGAILTNNKKLYEKLCIFRNHGITKERKNLKNKNGGPWYYEMQQLGFNYRITDIQAALGVSQLKKVDKFVARRCELSRIFNNAFKGIHWIKFLENGMKNSCAFHIYVVLIDFKRINKTRKEVMAYLKKCNVGTQVHYIPLYRQPYYKETFGYMPADFPVAEEYYKAALTLPLHQDMTKRELNYVVDKVSKLSLNT